ncbi:CRUM1-like protein [Mya arenaria]|uniref:CRUM1-like protein n=1 Tax=Mya arenaria TaxID=6604 RepID=A0ABY7DDC3_MYAAR|nr:CRUM1-like protein [Mya arenaria]
MVQAASVLLIVLMGICKCCDINDIPGTVHCSDDNSTGLNKVQKVRRKRGFGEALLCVLTFFSCLWYRPRPSDTTPPQLMCPNGITYGEIEPFQIYRKVYWNEPSAKDDRDGYVTAKRMYGRPSGSRFPEGWTEVRYEAKDRRGNRATCTMQIHIQNVEPPQFDTCPSIVVSGTDKGSNTSSVSWPKPTAIDNSNGKINVMISRGPGPESKLYPGRYEIEYVARDKAGNKGRPCRFNVIVRDIKCSRIYPTPYVRVICPQGYKTGSLCDIECEPGNLLKGSDNVTCEESKNGLFAYWNWQNGTQSTCKNIDNCMSKPCLHGECSDRLNGYDCTCDVGFTSQRCDVNIDDCTANVCMNGATCVDEVASYNCSCVENYTGKYCEIEKKHGQWSVWGNWSECTTTCGRGQMSRKRLCTNPTPSNGGDDCAGLSEDFQPCNNTDCPDCPALVVPGNGTAECKQVNGTFNCSIYCDEGFEFDMEPLHNYYCGPETAHVWNFDTFSNPLRKLPSCKETVVPKSLSVRYSAKYKDLKSNPKDWKIIEDQ